MADKPRRLGRGLEALLTPSAPQASAGDDRALRRLPIPQIRPNPFQPRKEFREEDLAELESSLKANGLLQPITVRPVRGAGAGGTAYELVAGERRLRAATRLGWTDIPAVIKEVDDRALLTLALVENLQRADLNPVEEAEGYRQLIDEFSLTQQQVAEAVGKDRSTVANLLRLLALPAAVRRMLEQGELTAGHARALLALPDEQTIVAMATEAARDDLSVRDVERRVQEAGSERKAAPAGNGASRGAVQDPAVRRITDLLRRRLQTDVSVTADDRHRGQLHISFYSADDLQRLLELLLGANPDEM